MPTNACHLGHLEGLNVLEEEQVADQALPQTWHIRMQLGRIGAKADHEVQYIKCGQYQYVNNPSIIILSENFKKELTRKYSGSRLISYLPCMKKL